ncbi:MAG TPA: hypothetical protein VGN81_15760 [Pseudonocardiaceae bacterium]|jgi:hypothetical protein
MERQLIETVWDSLPEEQSHWLRTMAQTSTQVLIQQLVDQNVLPDTDSDRKPGEIADEPQRRVATLRRVKAAQVIAALLTEVVTDITAEEAARAVWLGASLADLGSASGSTRQAARKRWPDLGQIYRMRRWLSGHYQDIFGIADSLIRLRGSTAPKHSVTPATVATAYDLLIHDLEEVRADFASGSVVVIGETSNVQIIRWQRLGELIDKRIRLVVDLIISTDHDADFAIKGAKGMLAYYDSVNLTPSP